MTDTKALEIALNNIYHCIRTEATKMDNIQDMIKTLCASTHLMLDLCWSIDPNMAVNVIKVMMEQNGAQVFSGDDPEQLRKMQEVFKTDRQSKSDTVIPFPSNRTKH